jgi:U4/U6.U5 tri-snRNP-associated protein 1
MNEEETVTTEEISLSIEETNKLRVSLGLKPLDEGKGNKKDQAASVNFANERKRMAERQKR